MTGTLWRPLLDELNRWTDAGLEARLWLRDDDAVEPSAALDRMDGLSLVYSVPMTLAVIPVLSGEALANRIERTAFMNAAVHGWSHTNYAPFGEKKQEFGPHRPRRKMLSELWLGRTRLQELFGERLLPMFVPPWNRIDSTLVPKLRFAGYQALSAFGRETLDGLVGINTHVDIIDWHGTRGCIGHSVLVERLAEELTASRLSNQYPVGLLTHHLVHDESAFVFLEALFNAIRSSPCQWLDPGELMPRPSHTA